LRQAEALADFFDAVYNLHRWCYLCVIRHGCDIIRVILGKLFSI
jgi:hypothetical protein